MGSKPIPQGIDPLRYKCPYCGVPKGTRCNTIGQFRTLPVKQSHNARIARAIARRQTKGQVVLITEEGPKAGITKSVDNLGSPVMIDDVQESLIDRLANKEKERLGLAVTRGKRPRRR